MTSPLSIPEEHWSYYEATLAARSLRDFLSLAWPVVESTPFEPAWHIDAICDHLEMVTAGEIDRLAIMIPPGHAKSLVVSVVWPAWEWLERPQERTIFASHDKSLTVRDSRRTRQIVRSPLYRSWVEALCEIEGVEPWDLAGDQNLKTLFENDRGGFRQCVTVGSGITGHRPHKVVIDDPIDVKKAVLGSPEQVARRMEEVRVWHDQVLSSRFADMRNPREVLIMQRVHELDLAGVLAERDGVEVLCLPSEYQPLHHYVYRGDPREVEGELLFPQRYPAEVVERAKVELGSAQYAAQHQQSPTPAEGGLFRREWVQERHYYRTPPQEIAKSLEEVCIFVDCAFKGSKGSDPVGMLVVGRKGATRYLLGRLNARLELPGTCDALADLARAWPLARAKVIEDKANGPAVIQVMRRRLTGLIAWSPDKHGDKYARAQVAAVEWEAGNWRFPHPDLNPWVSDYLEALFSFPFAAHDEDVDCTAMASIRWRDAGVGSRVTATTGRTTHKAAWG